MAKCEVCDKGIQTGHRISITRSHVSRRANRLWKPNIKKVRLEDENGNTKTVKMCVKCKRNLKSKAI